MFVNELPTRRYEAEVEETDNGWFTTVRHWDTQDGVNLKIKAERIEYYKTEKEALERGRTWVMNPKPNNANSVWTWKDWKRV